MIYAKWTRETTADLAQNMLADARRAHRLPNIDDAAGDAELHRGLMRQFDALVHLLGWPICDATLRAAWDLPSLPAAETLAVSIPRQFATPIQDGPQMVDMTGAAAITASGAAVAVPEGLILSVRSSRGMVFVDVAAAPLGFVGIEIEWAFYGVARSALDLQERYPSLYGAILDASAAAAFGHGDAEQREILRRAAAPLVGISRFLPAERFVPPRP